ncbi:MAG: disulfide bond formation protein B [Actinobacteria bacterium]|nr:disulfide bond formation protein B [Actinomycetota bacterium]
MVQVLLALLIVLSLVSLVVPSARNALVWLRDSFTGTELWFAWGIALVATLGSLFFSEFADFVPCRLCWFQRIAMYPLAIVLLVGALRRDVRAAVQYAFVLPILGAMVSIYHIWIELHPEDESAGCKVGGSCATKWIDEFGYVTIPTLALTAFAAIGAFLAFAWSRRAAAGER